MDLIEYKYDYTAREVQTFINAYVEAALFCTHCETDAGDYLADAYSDDDLADETRAEIFDDCIDFLGLALPTLETAGVEPEQAGHDFLLTREGHGAGFWDRGLGEAGQRLTEMADSYGAADFYAGDDGKIHAG